MMGCPICTVKHYNEVKGECSHILYTRGWALRSISFGGPKKPQSDTIVGGDKSGLVCTSENTHQYLL